MACTNCAAEDKFQTGAECPEVAYQRSTVCAAVTVTPKVSVGDAAVFCCGDPVVNAVTSCAGRKNGSCTFTITQSICVAVPVTFTATAAVGDPYVNCGEASAEDDCSSCEEEK